MTITGSFQDCFLEDVQKLQEEGFPAFDTDLFANMGQLCRVCARPHEDMVPIFSGRGQQLGVDKMIHGHLPIKVTKYDKLPAQLCSLCMERLLVCDLLVAECAEADKKLKAMLTNGRAADDKVLSQVEDDVPELLLDSEMANPDVKMPEVAGQLSGGAEMLRLDCHDPTVDSLICGAPCELMLDASDPIAQMTADLGHASYHFYSDCGEDHCSSLETSPTWKEILEVAEISESEMVEPVQESLEELGLDATTGVGNKKFGRNENATEMMEAADISDLDSNCEMKAVVENLFLRSPGHKNDAGFVDAMASETGPLVEAISEVVTVASSGEVLPPSFEDDKMTCITIPELNVSDTLEILPDAETMNIINRDSSVSQMELLDAPDGQNSDGNYSFITDLDSLPSSDLLSDMGEGGKVLDLPFQQQFPSVAAIEELSAASEQVMAATSITPVVLEQLGSGVAGDVPPVHLGNRSGNQLGGVQSRINITSNKPQTLDCGPPCTDPTVAVLNVKSSANVNGVQVPYIRVLPDKSTEVRARDKCLYDAIKVKRASRVNMIVLKAEHLQKELPQATIMANILEAVRKMNVKRQQDKTTNKVGNVNADANEEKVNTEVTSTEAPISVNDINNKPAVKMENIAKLQLVNLELMPKLAPDENHPPKRIPYLYMKVSEKFDNIEEKPKSAIVGAIHNLVSRDAARKPKEGSKEKERGYKCTVCDARFELWRAWRTHEREHRLGSIPQCNTCHKVFKNENSLRFHMRRHLLGAPTKRYMCQTCEKMFYSRAAAKDHARIHTGERPFVCPTCSKAFTRKFALKMHQRSHLRTREPKPTPPRFVCAACGEELPSESAWKAHTRLHLEEMPYKCGTCHRSFVSAGNFKSHLKKCGQMTSTEVNVPRIICLPDVSAVV